ncbi:MAG: phosphoribosylanthranilate isomerase [Tannerellaceae bacterium]|jgi:phosphoribosylanthranilate isomerase|nr:phosphoribosylanthranilate isomerase [Tannerellaceae bacterium]
MIIKVCGMRDPENMLQVAGLDIQWMGFIFYAGSDRRFVAPDDPLAGEKERTLTDCLPSVNPRLKKAGVFVDASLEEMMRTAARYGLDYLQLHGGESPDTCYALQKRGFALIKAFPVATAEDLERTTAYHGRADYFLFDTKCAGYGGSGRSFDWTILSAYKGETPFLLSGGLHPGSIGAIRRFHHPRLAGIDLNSGFELEKGIKNVPELSGFIHKLQHEKI